MKTFFRKTALILALTSLTFVACKKKEDAKPNIPSLIPNACNLVKLQEGAPRMTEPVNYVLEYDSQDRLIKSTQIVQTGSAVTTFEYNSNNKLSKSSYYFPSTAVYPYQYAEYTYTTNLISVRWYTKDIATGNYVQDPTDTQYELDVQGKLLKISYPATANSVARYLRYEYNVEGNVSKEYSFVGVDAQSKESLEGEFTSYDTKRNPLYENETLRIIRSSIIGGVIPMTGGRVLSKNNLLKGRRFEVTYDYTYTYNDKNYPLTASNNPSVGNTLESAITYEYKCK